jgi:quercetin dioxygenase-like cupin family protein
MKIESVPFIASDWEKIKPEKINGESGFSMVRKFEQGNVRVRMAEYSPDYRADHWCEKGHVVLVLEGALTIEIKDGRSFVLNQGMSFQVADGIDAHKAFSERGAKVFIID